MSMKKKLVSVLLAAAMAMTVLPVTAAAEGNTLTYAISSECETLDPGMCNYLGSSGMIMTCSWVCIVRILPVRH